MRRVFRRRRGYLAAAGGACLLAAVALIPVLRPAVGKPGWVAGVQVGLPVRLQSAATPLPDVTLPLLAQPQDPGAAPASAPVSTGIHDAALVIVEDRRLRALLHQSIRLPAPAVLAARGGLPTLVLPARPYPYTGGDLRTAHALISVAGHPGTALLVDNVLVASGATLQLGSSGNLHRLLMDSGGAGFTSIVSWGGTLQLAGTSQAPFDIIGWDEETQAAARDVGHGRPYIRAVGGRFTMSYVHESALGFWSGRTGGVAWTGISRANASGGADHSWFIGNVYGAFVSRAQQVSFSDDLFEGNELDGLRLHRGTISTQVSHSASARNGLNGFVVDRGASQDVLSGDVAVNNGGNGFLIDGRALVPGASPSGESAGESSGNIVSDSEATGNAKAGVLVEGGHAPVIQRTIVCAATSAIALRYATVGAVITGNDVRCGGRVALSIGPGVTGTTVADNLLTSARIGLLVHNAAGLRLLGNTLSLMSVFGVSIRGASPGIVGDNNVISGRGFRPVDLRAGASAPALTNTDSAGWKHLTHLNVWNYLRYHPIMLLWACIIGFVILASVLSKLRRRRRRTQLYAHRFGHEAALAHLSLHPLTLTTATIGATPNGHSHASLHAATNNVGVNGSAHADLERGAYVPAPANEATR